MFNVAVTTCILLFLAGCTRGGSEGEAARSEAPADRGASRSEGVSSGDDSSAAWKAGTIPKAAAEGTPRAGGDLVVGLWSEPTSLNRHLDPDWVAIKLSEHLYEGLVALDPYDHPRYRVKPALAERWEVSDDKRTYTFHLRKGVSWHDGKPFTGHDVIATFDKVLDPTTRAAHMRAYLEELAGYELVDDHTVRFTFRRPYFLVLDLLADMAIQPAHIIGKLTGAQYNEAAKNPLNRHPVGTGPFLFVTWKANEKIVLARHQGYWGDKAHVDRVILRIVPDAAVRKQLALRGDLDLWTRVMDAQWARMDEPYLREHFHRSSVYDASYTWIGWNSARPFFADKWVRRALTLLLNRERIAKALFYGLRKPTGCAFYWASPACEGIEPLPYDPRKADALLTQTGWDDSDGDGVRDKAGVPFRFTFMIPASSDNAEKLGTIMKEDFRRHGIEVDLQRVEWSAYLKRLRRREFDACTLQWGGGPRLDPTQVWHSRYRQEGSNYVGFSHTEADQLMEQARVTFDDARRTALYRRLGQILAAEQPYTWLFVTPQLSLVHERVKGARQSLLWWQFADMWLQGDRARP